jgi:hypothetical protein
MEIAESTERKARNQRMERKTHCHHESSKVPQLNKTANSFNGAGENTKEEGVI